MSLWPAMICAMCGGSPAMIASVMKTLRKSCGVQCSGLPSAAVSPAAANAASSMSRTDPALILRCSEPYRRWNSTGAGGSQVRSWES